MTEAGIGRPKALSGLGLIVRRELLVYFGSVGGYVIASLMLAILGLLFNTRAVGGGSKYSVEVLTEFFNSAGGLVLVASCFIAMRLIAEERQAGTLALLQSSALTEGEVVLAKFLSAWLFLGAIMAASIYMPALIFLHGKVSVGHIFAGYLGTCLLGGAVIAIGTFGSAVAKTQVVGRRIFYNGSLWDGNNAAANAADDLAVAPDKTALPQPPTQSLSAPLEHRTG